MFYDQRPAADPGFTPRCRTQRSVQIEIALRLDDRLVLRLLERFFEALDSASPRVFSDCTDCSKSASRRAFSSARIWCASSSFGLSVRSGSTWRTTRRRPLVDDERGLAARARRLRTRFWSVAMSLSYAGCPATGSMCASPRTTSTVRADSIGARGPERIAKVLAGVGADIVALQEVVGPGPCGRRARRRDRRRARHGRHDGADARVPASPVRQCWCSADSRSVSTRQLDLTWKTCEPRNSQRVGDRTGRRPRCCRCTTCISARRCSNAGTRRRSSRHGFTTRACQGRRSCWAISTSGAAGWSLTCSPSRLHSVDLFPHLKRRRTYPGLLSVPAPRPHLFRGQHRDPAHRTAAHAARAGRVRPSAAGGRH